MAKLAACFGTSHSTMLFSAVENWQALFDHVDCKAPINDFEGTPRSFEYLLKNTPAAASANIAKEAIAERHKATTAAMDRLANDIATRQPGCDDRCR